jgi:hypothetical protein
MTGHDYFKKPHNLTQVLAVLDKSHPEIVEKALRQFPSLRLLSDLKQTDSIQANSTLQRVKHLLLKHNLHTEAAELLVQAGEIHQAKQVLDDAIRRNNTAALRGRIHLAIHQGLVPGYTMTSECELLKKILDNSKSAPAMQAAATELLAVLCMSSKHPDTANIFLRNIQLPSEHKIKFTEALEHLFNMQGSELSTPHNIMSALNHIEQQLHAALPDEASEQVAPYPKEQIAEASHWIKHFLNVTQELKQRFSPIMMAFDQANASVRVIEDEEQFFDAEEGPGIVIPEVPANSVINTSVPVTPQRDTSEARDDVVPEIRETFVPEEDEDSGVLETVNNSTPVINMTEHNHPETTRLVETPMAEEPLSVTRSIYSSLLSQPVYSRSSDDFLAPELRRAWVSALSSLSMRVN